MPEIQIPELKIPEIRLPEISVPKKQEKRHIICRKEEHRENDYGYLDKDKDTVGVDYPLTATFHIDVDFGGNKNG